MSAISLRQVGAIIAFCTSIGGSGYAAMQPGAVRAATSAWNDITTDAAPAAPAGGSRALWSPVAAKAGQLALPTINGKISLRGDLNVIVMPR